MQPSCEDPPALSNESSYLHAQGAEAPSIFLFNLGPLSPIVIFHMHQANPQNLYIDVDGVLDALLSGRQRHEPAHYTGAGHACVCADWLVVAEPILAYLLRSCSVVW
jgi:hypothetical protein